MKKGDYVTVKKEKLIDNTWLEVYKKAEPLLVTNSSNETISFFYNSPGMEKTGKFSTTCMEKDYFELAYSFILKKEFKEYFIDNNT